MDERDAGLADRIRETEVGRRDALKALVGGGLVLGGAKAADNVLVGYGVLTGTNLVDQDLAPLAMREFHPRSGYGVRQGDHVVAIRDGRAEIALGDERLATPRLESLTAASGDAYDLPSALSGLLADVGAVARSEITFEFHRFDAFFDRLDSAESRPLATGAIRRWPAADPALVEAFADVDPADPAELLTALVSGFRTHTYYDAPRYAAGSIQDNVIFGAADLRAPFRDPVDFESITDGPETGMFCYEFTNRSLEALHTVAATEQRVPVAGASVVDARHKHVYTGVASVVRDDGDLRVPMTFVDYTHSTLNDDLRLRGVLGEGFEAYNRRHRATEINWDPFV